MKHLPIISDINNDDLLDGMEQLPLCWGPCPKVREDMLENTGTVYCYHKNANEDIKKDIINFVSSSMKMVRVLALLIIMIVYGFIDTQASPMTTNFPHATDDSLITETSQDTSIWKEVNLKGAVVTGSNITQKGNRTRVFITDELRKGTVTTSQMLGKLPDFYYNYGSRELTYNNSSDIVVLVDSIPRDLSYLNNIQHLRFDKVEIISHPQGLYHGHEVLINLHTKEHYIGYEGTVYADGALNFNKANDKHFIFDNSNMTFSAVKDKWNFYVHGFQYFGQTKTTMSWTKEYLMSDMKEESYQSGRTQRNRTSYERQYRANVSVDYTINKKQSLSFVYQLGNAGNNFYYPWLVRRIQNYTSSSPDTTYLTDDSRSHSSSTEHSLALFYRNNQGKVNFTTNVNYRFSPSCSMSDDVKSTGYEAHNHFRNEMNYLRYQAFASRNYFNNALNLQAAYIFTWKDYKMRNKDSHDLLNANSYIRNQFDFGGSYTFRNNAMLALSGWIEQVHAKSNGSKKNQTSPIHLPGLAETHG